MGGRQTKTSVDGWHRIRGQCESLAGHILYLQVADARQHPRGVLMKITNSPSPSSSIHSLFPFSFNLFLPCLFFLISHPILLLPWPCIITSHAVNCSQRRPNATSCRPFFLPSLKKQSKGKETKKNTKQWLFTAAAPNSRIYVRTHTQYIIHQARVCLLLLDCASASSSLSIHVNVRVLLSGLVSQLWPRWCSFGWEEAREERRSKGLGQRGSLPTKSLGWNERACVWASVCQGESAVTTTATSATSALYFLSWQSTGVYASWPIAELTGIFGSQT